MAKSFGEDDGAADGDVSPRKTMRGLIPGCGSWELSELQRNRPGGDQEK